MEARYYISTPSSLGPRTDQEISKERYIKITTGLEDLDPKYSITVRLMPDHIEPYSGKFFKDYQTWAGPDINKL